MNSNKLTSNAKAELLIALKTRFEHNMTRHTGIKWQDVLDRIEFSEAKLWTISEMERTGGEPDVVILDNDLCYCDCSAESPKGRRSLCYDLAAWESRKENKPLGNAMEMADEMGIEIFNESQYRTLQQLGKFDLKTSSWIVTPENIRNLGGALFCDRRYNTVFLYHNGAESYYAARAFRGFLKL